MANNIETQSKESDSRRRSWWKLAIATMSLVVVPGLLVSVLQPGKYVWDESDHARTIGGVLHILLGFLGASLLVFLIRKKRQFAELPTIRQWIVVVVFPLCFGGVYALSIAASRRSTTLVVPRLFAPTAVVSYDVAQSPQQRTEIEFRNTLRSHHPGGRFAHRSDGDHDVERFSAVFERRFLRRPAETDATLEGHTRMLGNGTVEIIELVSVSLIPAVQQRWDNQS